ncbi:dioxygenase [Pendulispora rubella]|uniref:Dioxygenase n=1 Tax=Pendulispora rubella TaxID=2741070 RepID=A0ABZ2KPA4_9BACT
MGRDEHEDPGLFRDLGRMAQVIERRQALRWLAAAGLVPLFGCGSDDASGGGSDGGTGNGDGSCSVSPEETAGPYPGDGSNGPNALSTSGVVRSDIRSSFGTLSGTAEGILTTVTLTLVNTNANCAALSNYAIYLWHCDQSGNYSLYAQADQNYLRGVQVTDAHGSVSFISIFPACYSGRWPHMHIEVYPSAALATGSGNKIKTTQLALPEDACQAVYATSGYSQSATNLSRVSLASDNVFSDGYSLELATATGNVTDGYTVTLTIGVAA